MPHHPDKLWSGRFEDRTDPSVERFTASVSFDRRLCTDDIAGSVAHARMLNRTGVLDDEELRLIVNGLAGIQKDVDGGKFQWREELEDVHMNIESALTERIGDAGRKLHAGRSRNDQAATDIRMYARRAIDRVIEEIRGFQSVLLDVAEQEADTVMPGYTHLQIAQPVTFGHHMMAWFEMLRRDRQRFADARKRVNLCPLGAAALAGTTVPIDRKMTAEELGFDDPCPNSLDAVSDRDFAIETASCCALTMVHLSRFSEEIVLWTSEAYGFVSLPDAFATGSSIMPQKKNPDVAELVRGKSARVAGGLQTLLMLMKGQPLAYNRDNQEDKEPLFDCLDTTLDCLTIMSALVRGMQPQRETMRQAAHDGFSTATDLAERLVGKGVAFRDAHDIVGRIVKHGIDNGRRLDAIDLATFQSFSEVIDEPLLESLTPEAAVAARDHLGGTAPSQVRSAVAQARRQLNE